MSKEFHVMKQLTIEKSDCWKKELVHMIHELYMHHRVINQLILSLEQRNKPNTSCNEAYQRGWVLFKEYLLKQ